jgi:ATP-dependent DNA ligase
VVCCDEKGVAAFHVLRHRRNEPEAFLYAFDLLELNGTDLRREPIEVRARRHSRACCAGACRACGSCRSGSARATCQAARVMA